MPSYWPKARVHLALWGAASSAKPTPDLVFRDVPVDQCVLGHTNYNEPDTFSLTLPREHLPVDVRAFRDILVRLWLGDAGGPGDVLTGDPQIMGFVDVPRMIFGESGDTVSLQGRDYTGTLKDEPWGRKFRVDLRQPLDVVMSQIVAHYPTAAVFVGRIDVFNEMGLPTVAPVLGGLTGRKRWFTWQADGMVWDALGSLASRAGWVLRVELDRLILQPSRAIYGSQAIQQPRFVWGRHLQSLSVERTMTRARVEGVRCVAYNTATGKDVVGKFPKRASTYHQMLPKASPNWTTNGVKALAEEVYWLMAHQQMKASIGTMEMDIDGTDITRIRPGQVLQVVVDPDVEARLAQRQHDEDQREIARKAAELQAAGLGAAVSKVMAENWREMLVPWVIESCSHRWDRGSAGYSFSAELVNVLAAEQGAA